VRLGNLPEGEKIMQSEKKGVVYVPAGERRSVWATGDTCTFKVVGEDTGGALTLFVDFVPPQGGPPPHIHHREEEAFYLLEGELEFQAEEDRTLTVDAGSFLYIPKGTVHGFKNFGVEDARMLTILTPAGIEGFFFEGGRPATEWSNRFEKRTA
jgi:quercetin dioxygenase-like cupin family protein